MSGAQTETDRPPASTSSDVPLNAANAVLVESTDMPEGSIPVRGYDFNKPLDYHALLQSFTTTGLQATNFGLAVEQINKMRSWRLSDDPVADNEDDDLKTHEARSKVQCKIFLGYTSNLISAGVRETLRFLVQHKMVDCIVSSAGGIEEDFIKCLAPTYLGDFRLPGAKLRSKGINRIANMLVPNKNYCLFEDWFMPILDEMLAEQKSTGEFWSPSKMIRRMGLRIDNPDSVYYWAAKNNIPVFCPSITDGSIGDMVYFHSYKNPGLVIDVAQDVKGINDEAISAKKSGMIILGGGLVKHHICNANLMRNGADYAVFVNTAQEFDGSDAGARPDEAVSWGKIKPTTDAVKIYGEATIVFPLLVAETFARDFHGMEAVDDQKLAEKLSESKSQVIK